MGIKRESGCTVHMKSDIKQMTMKIKNEPEYSDDHTDVGGSTLKFDEDAPQNVYNPEKMIKTEPDDGNDREEEKCGIKKEIVNTGKKVHKPKRSFHFKSSNALHGSDPDFD